MKYLELHIPVITEDAIFPVPINPKVHMMNYMINLTTM